MSATTRRHQYTPEVDVGYKIVARTFSREGMRPSTSPARMKQTLQQRKKKLSLSPGDVSPVTQTSNAQETFRSLLMLNQNSPKVNPKKFLELKKLMNQPSPLPVSPRSDVSTPHLVKAMFARAKTAESSFMNRSKQTQHDYRSRMLKSSSSVSRSQHLTLQNSDAWEGTYDRPSLSYSNSEVFRKRCIRCSKFPDIQIEGNSLSRIVTNRNVSMSKEHCEVLGASSCPDCIRVRSQLQHDIQCNKNTPPIANDVYKIALVHEQSPHMTRQEVQRKFFDGEISDKVLPLPYWSQSDSLTAISDDYPIQHVNKNYEENDKFLPFINDATQPNSTSRQPKLFSKSNPPEFETIFEASESTTISESNGERLAITEDNTDDENTTNEISYQRHNNIEELMAVQVFPASEKFSSKRYNVDATEFNKNDIKLTRSKVRRKKPFPSQKVVKVEAGNQTELNLEEFQPESQTRKTKRCFTLNLIPSNDFFFNISDLAERIRKSGVVKTKRSPQKTDFSSNDLNLNEKIANVSVEKLETESVKSNDSLQPIKEFNMSYEPPFFFDYRGHLGVGSTISRRSSAVSKA